MSRLLHIAQQEVKKVQAKSEELNSTEPLNIYLDWGRNSKSDLRLLTTVNVPKRIAKELKSKQNY